MYKIFLVIQIGLIVILSSILKYQTPDFKDTNWDIVLFLTPYGIINNYVNKNASVMWSFYSDISTGQLQISNFQIILSAAVYFSMIFSVMLFIKREKSN